MLHEGGREGSFTSTFIIIMLESNTGYKIDVELGKAVTLGTNTKPVSYCLTVCNVEHFFIVNMCCLQAALDLMSKGHMLADVVAIIGKYVCMLSVYNDRERVVSYRNTRHCFW